MTKKVCVALVSTMALLGCMAEGEDIEALERDAEIEEIVENLELAGYPASEIDVDDEGVVIVGGDAVVSLQASREMVGDQVGDNSFRQYRTTNLVSQGLTICLDGSGLSGTLSQALDGAVDRYNNDVNLSLNFVRVGSGAGNTNINKAKGGNGGGNGGGGGGGGGDDGGGDGGGSGCDATINVQAKGPAGGQAGFPEGGLPYTNIQVGKGTASYGLAVARHVIIHEIGHCIGLRHSDYFNRSISCGTGGNEGSSGVGAHHISGTPTGAVEDGSIYNSCFHTGSNGEFTNSDQSALNTLY